jgi:hypothetical protein
VPQSSGGIVVTRALATASHCGASVQESHEGTNTGVQEDRKKVLTVYRRLQRWRNRGDSSDDTASITGALSGMRFEDVFKYGSVSGFEDGALTQPCIEVHRGQQIL